MKNSKLPRKTKAYWAFLRSTGSVLLFFLALGSGLSNQGCQQTDAPTEPLDPNAKIFLKSPSGGEKVKVGDTLWIRWNVKDDSIAPIEAVDLMISPDSGKNWGFARNGSIPIESGLWGKYPWVVGEKTVGTPLLNLVSSACMFRVMLYATKDSAKIATTKATFTISAP